MNQKFQIEKRDVTLSTSTISIILLFSIAFLLALIVNNPQAYSAQQRRFRQNQPQPTKTRKQEAVSYDLTKLLPKKTKALLFSVNNYEQGPSGLPNLEGCNNDIFEWDILLKEPQGTGRLTSGPLSPKTDLFTFSDAPEVSTNPPTYKNFMDALKKIASRTDVPADRLLVIFSGHGVSAHGKSFLCPQDAIKDGLNDATNKNVLKCGLKNNLIPISTVINILNNSDAKEIVLIIDACRNATNNPNIEFMREFASLLTRIKQKELRKNFAIITSCSLGQTAHECVFDDCMHGVFMYHFLDGLVNCKADYTGCYDGKITLVEAYNYAYAQTAREARILGAIQTPEIYISASAKTKKDSMCMAAYNNFPKMEKETALNDIQFLTQSGLILANNKRTPYENKLAIRAFDCVINNIPSNTLAYTLRGGLHRMYGNYSQALNDCQQAGIQLTLNVSQDLKISLTNGQNQALHKGDTVNVKKVNDNKILIDSVNEIPIPSQFWLETKHVEWTAQAASNRFRNSATQSQADRYPGGPAGWATSPLTRGWGNNGTGTGMGFMK